MVRALTMWDSGIVYVLHSLIMGNQSVPQPKVRYPYLTYLTLVLGAVLGSQHVLFSVDRRFFDCNADLSCMMPPRYVLDYSALRCMTTPCW